MKDIIKRFAIWLVQGIVGAVFVLAFAFALVEWAAGCGETYVDSNGRTHINKCVITSIKF